MSKGPDHYSATIVTDHGVTVNEYRQAHLDSLILSINFMRQHGRDLTANDLAEFLVLLGGPNMMGGLSPRHEGIV